MIKSCISYYGGKAMMVKTILPLIPAHEVYVEPFFGAGSVFFAKDLVKLNVVNDINGQIVNFWRVMQHPRLFRKFRIELACLLHSRQLFDKAHEQLETEYKPSLIGKLLFKDRKMVADAMALFICLNQGMYGLINTHTWNVLKKPENSRPNIIKNFDAVKPEIHQKLRRCYIECKDAVEVIERYSDNENAFFYCDPPYPNSDKRPYNFYNWDDYKRLLSALTKVKGKFLLSSYHSDVLKSVGKENGWYYNDYEKVLCVAALNKAKGIEGKRVKTEVLISNYEI